MASSVLSREGFLFFCQGKLPSYMVLCTWCDIIAVTVTYSYILFRINNVYDSKRVCVYKVIDNLNKGKTREIITQEQE